MRRHHVVMAHKSRKFSGFRAGWPSTAANCLLGSQSAEKRAFSAPMTCRATEQASRGIDRLFVSLGQEPAGARLPRDFLLLRAIAREKQSGKSRASYAGAPALRNQASSVSGIGALSDIAAHRNGPRSRGRCPAGRAPPEGDKRDYAGRDRLQETFRRLEAGPRASTLGQMPFRGLPLNRFAQK